MASRLGSSTVLFALAWGFSSLAIPSTPLAQAPPTALDSLLAAPVLDLALLERTVLARNPSLAAMKAAWEESKARADRAGALMDPMAEAMAAPRALGNEAMMAPGYVVGVSQLFPIFGERGLEKRAARAEARAAGENARSMRLDLLREARRLFYEYFLVERGTDVNVELQGLVGQFRNVALRKYAAGVVGQQDALQADVELAMLSHQSIVLVRDRRIVLARLNALLHRAPEEVLPAPGDSIPAPRSGEEFPVPAEHAAHTRPDIRRAQAEQDARAAELSLARRRRLPEVSLLARYDGMEADHEMRPMFGVGLKLPIWFGRLGAAEREAAQALRRTEQERLALLDRARAEIEEARARVEETRHEIEVIEAGVLPATERALASLRAGYEANRSDFLSLLNAERDLARARLEWHRARSEYRMALADWERAIARDVSGEEVTR